MCDMNFTIDEIFNEAIMSNTPVIVVEGINDVKIYSEIASSIMRKVEVYAIETIQGYSEGCKHVIDAIKEIYGLNPNAAVEDHILGVIDRDVREFRGELPVEKAFLILESYSIESHFVTKEVFEQTISNYTNVGKPALGRRFIEIKYGEVEGKLLDLYYFSLESLKYALNEGYRADYQYSFAHNRRKQQPVLLSIQEKIPDLDQFAASLNISRDMRWLRKIASGKWLLRTFAEEIHEFLSGFSAYCGAIDTEQCQFCKRNVVGKCTYKLKDGVTNKTIYSLASENVRIPSLDYIRQRISTFPN